MNSNDVSTTLRWNADPLFPRDPGAVEMSVNLQQWFPVLHFPLIFEATGTGEDATVTFTSFDGPRRFFRLNSDIPGPP